MFIKKRSGYESVSDASLENVSVEFDTRAEVQFQNPKNFMFPNHKYFL